MTGFCRRNADEMLAIGREVADARLAAPRMSWKELERRYRRGRMQLSRYAALAARVDQAAAADQKDVSYETSDTSEALKRA